MLQEVFCVKGWSCAPGADYACLGMIMHAWGWLCMPGADYACLGLIMHTRGWSCIPGADHATKWAFAGAFKSVCVCTRCSLPTPFAATRASPRSCWHVRLQPQAERLLGFHLVTARPSKVKLLCLKPQALRLLGFHLVTARPSTLSCSALNNHFYAAKHSACSTLLNFTQEGHIPHVCQQSEPRVLAVCAWVPPEPQLDWVAYQNKQRSVYWVVEPTVSQRRPILQPLEAYCEPAEVCCSQRKPILQPLEAYTASIGGLYCIHWRPILHPLEAYTAAIGGLLWAIGSLMWASGGLLQPAEAYTAAIGSLLWASGGLHCSHWKPTAASGSPLRASGGLYCSHWRPTAASGGPLQPAGACLSQQRLDLQAPGSHLRGLTWEVPTWEAWPSGTWFPPERLDLQAPGSHLSHRRLDLQAPGSHLRGEDGRQARPPNPTVLMRPRIKHDGTLGDLSWGMQGREHKGHSSIQSLEVNIEQRVIESAHQGKDHQRSCQGLDTQQLRVGACIPCRFGHAHWGTSIWG